MSTSPNTAPWQLGPVTAASRVAAAALAVIAIDSTFAWRSMPLLASIAFLIIPLLVAIRVVRGFPGSLGASAVVLAGTTAFTTLLIASPTSRPDHLSAALLVAVVVSAIGLAAVAVAWRGGRLV